MGYEIDFLSVGENSQSGDAIALRWGDLHGPRRDQRIAVIDGGFRDTGKALVEHILSRYNTDSVDFVLSTHPDDDHANGLLAVLEGLTVGTLLMHRPWAEEHTNNISDLFKSGRVTDKSIRERLQKSLDTASELEESARAKGINIQEPFAGVSSRDGTFRILGPTRSYYESLLPEFRSLPETRVAAPTTLFTKASDAVAGWLEESLNIETLADKDDTSPENNSSAIALLTVEGRASLFTSDAGKPALTAAMDRLDAEGFDYQQLCFVQVPHHGSRRNVGPTVLNRLLGPKLGSDQKTRTAFVSSAKQGAPKHPSRKVTNAFRRRGAPVFSTAENGNQWHRHDAPARDDYFDITPLPLYDQVEE